MKIQITIVFIIVAAAFIFLAAKFILPYFRKEKNKSVCGSCSTPCELKNLKKNSCDNPTQKEVNTMLIKKVKKAQS